MDERVAIQKEFGAVRRVGNELRIKKFGSKEVSGTLSFIEIPKPVPYIFVGDLNVAEDSRGEGLSSQLLAEIERISKKSGVPVMLTAAIEADKNIHAVGMYDRRKGWTKINNTRHPNFYVFGDTREENVAKLIEHYSSHP